MNLLSYILTKMANDGRSALSANRIYAFVSKGQAISSIPDVMDLLNKKNEVEKDMPFILKAINKAALIFIIILLPFYYLFTVIAFLPFFFIGLFKGKDYEQTMHKDSWNKLFEHWGKYPNSFVIKAIEAYYFRTESIENPSLEIGVYRGDTSQAVFLNSRLNVGMEFVPLHLLHYAANNSNVVHEKLISGDIYNIPFCEGTFSSVFTVHSLDDIQRGIEGALAESSRVLLPGGKLVFSTYSGYFGQQNIIINILKSLGLERLAAIFFKIIYIGTDNIFEKIEWYELLKKHNMVVERFNYFIPMSVARLIDIPFRLEGYLINLFNFHKSFAFCMLPYLVEVYRKFLMNVICGVWAVSFDKSGNEKPGINIFVVAHKELNSLEPIVIDKELKFDFYANLLCPKCKSKINSLHTNNIIECSGCGSHYPCILGIPILLESAILNT